MELRIFPQSLINNTVEKRKVAGAILTLVGILFWLYVIATFRVWWVHPDNAFGLYQVIPFWFWVGVLSLVAGMLIAIDCAPKFLFLFQIIALNFMIWVTPVFIEPNARVTDTWNHYAYTNSIISTGHLIFNGVYEYWPGSFVFNAAVIQVIGIQFMSYLKFFPIISSTLFIFGYFLVVKRLFADVAITRFLIFIQILLNVWLQFHFSPQAFALILIPFIILPFIHKAGKTWILIAILLIGTLVISHPTTCLFIGTILMFIFLIDIIFNKSSAKLNAKTILKIILVSFPLFITLIVLENFGYLKLDAFDVLQSIPGGLWNILNRRLANPTSFIRLMTFALFGFLSIHFLYTSRENLNESRRKRFALGWLLATSLIFLFDLGYSGSHFHNRAIFFLYFLLPILAIMNINRSIRLRKFKQPILAFLVVLSLINVATVFYIENEALISDSNLSTVEFISNYAPNERIYAEQAATTVYGLVPNTTVIRLTSRGGIAESSLLVFDDYAMVSDIVGARTNYLFLKHDNVRYNDLVYSSGTFKIYLYNYTQTEGA